mgnify:CR=1 FL=1
MGRTGGARFAVLAHELGVARQTLRRALDAAIERGLVEANPGYGHPLRPEYVLTDEGRRLAPACRAVVGASRRSAPDLAGRKWTLPVLAAVHGGAHRFSEIEDALDDATPRALAMSLDELEEAGLLVRTLVDGRPPRPRYRVSRSARRLAIAAARLAADASA